MTGQRACRKGCAVTGEGEILRCAQDDRAKSLPEGLCRHLNGNSVLSGVPVVQFAGDGFFFLGLSGPVLFPDEIMTNEEKAQIYQLSKKLFARNEVDLTPSDRELIKRRVEKIYNNPLICGRLIDILYPENKQEETSEEIAAEVRAKGEK